MNELCADIGYKSINHFGEELCGDHVDVKKPDDSTSVIVLADGLGSGVKASILSTLTSGILSTMLSEKIDLEDCVETIAATLPVCKERGVAYSTFSIMLISENHICQLIQFDNPKIILVRNGVNTEYPISEVNIGGKKILKSKITINENDTFFIMSDGCPHAGVGKAYNFGWTLKEIAEYIEPLCSVGYTAKTLASILLEKIDDLYGGEPGDDATVCVVKIRKRAPVNMLFGPPSDKNDSKRMMSLFFSKDGKHIVCGGTTSTIAADYLKKPIKPNLNFPDPEIPPTAEIDGVDLVTEGVITVNKVLEYAKDYNKDNTVYSQWSMKHDGASLIARLLFEEATDINFFVGRAINPAHQNPNLPINFSIKMQLVTELSESLRQMGKRVKVSYF